MLTYADVCCDICRCCAKRRRGRHLRRTRRCAASVWQAGKPSPAYQVLHFTCFTSTKVQVLTRISALTEQKEELDGELASLRRIIAALSEKMDTWRLRHEILATQRDRGEATIRHLWQQLLKAPQHALHPQAPALEALEEAKKTKKESPPPPTPHPLASSSSAPAYAAPASAWGLARGAGCSSASSAASQVLDLLALLVQKYVLYW